MNERKENSMKRFVTVYTSNNGYEYWLKLEVDLIHSCRETLQVKNGNISFFVSSYSIDTLYSTCNWKDVFCVNKAGDRLTIEVADKKLDVKVEFSKKKILPY